MVDQELSPTSTFRSHGFVQERSDISNIHVREDVARAGRCGNVHLATGRTCLLPFRHGGPCHFVGPQDAQEMLRH
jgi:hypothetical protein